MTKKSSALALALVLIGATQVTADDLEPYLAHEGQHSKYQKALENQYVGKGWQNFAGIAPFQLNGERALFFAQLRLTCSKKPRYIKIRLARVHADGSLDTTGTNTWVMGKNAPERFTGSLWWESLTKYPVKPQFKVTGGKCVSTERQFKFWQP